MSGGSGAGNSAGVQSTGGGGGATPVVCTDSAIATGIFTTRYGASEIPLTDGQKSYFIQTNWWHLYTDQTVSYDGLSFTIGDPGGTSVPATDNAPAGFPSLFIGAYSGNATTGSGLPKQVSALSTVPTVFSTNSLEHDTSNFNAAYDVWLTASGTPLPDNAFSPGAGGAYLMVWLFKPSNRQPRGGNGTRPNFPDQTVDGVSGTWDVWVDNTSPPCVSYVSTTPLDSLSFDLNGFIRDAVANSYGVTDSMYLSIVFAGFEVWGGGDGLQVQQFCAQVN
jgi:hypothetical protein